MCPKVAPDKSPYLVSSKCILIFNCRRLNWDTVSTEELAIEQKKSFAIEQISTVYN